MRRLSRRWLAGVVAILVAGDWLSKLWVVNRVALGESRAVIEGWLYVGHRRNPGIAFGLLADLPEPWGMMLLSALGITAIVVFVGLMRSTPDRAARIAVALVAAGALGNLGDRLVNGSVTDFVIVAFFPYVFNLADAAITAGAALLVLRFAAVEPRRRDAAASAPS